MQRCPVCSCEIPGMARFCPGCASPVQGDVSASTVPSTPTPTPSSNQGQFAPGALIARRYRILDLLGRGGMGEVYRAHDIKLDQTVALKFLPEDLRRNAGALARLHSEVRIARQVSHPNVCRVYDIAEADGLHFLTMEFIDGEDLTHLLRRIGHFPTDKGIEIARKICAALAAAHSHGVLHRDLKPSNIMLNAAGQVRVTDFGLAVVADQVRGQDAGSGTPAYMAPEQLERREVTRKSDIYSLGAVLYEIFTGQHAFEGTGRAHLRHPSSLVKDIDPGVERVILHCLAPDPADRPDSATAVAMALPGGDPLAAALAAGETPSPEMVAGAGATIGISVRGAVSCLAVLVLSLIAGSWLGDRGLISGDASLDLPPEVLAAKAREIARSLGYQGKPRDRAFRMAYDTDYIRHLSSTNDRRPMRDRRPSPIYFWYRESPVPLLPGSLGGVKYLDPPATLPGMLALQLDSAGYLIQLRAVPEPASPTPQPFENWTTLFAAAGLELRDFEEIGPQWAPPLLPDARKAWKGNYPGQPEPPVRVEAGTVAGRIAYFRVFHPWTNPRDSEPARTVSVRTGSTAFASSPGTAIWWWAFSLLASGLALHNLRNGRGDRRGAFRVAMYIFLMQLAQATAAGDLAHPFERELLAVYRSVMLAVQVWLAYIGLEPLARRIWPQTLISWSRLLAGRWRDPLLGRDLLIGVAAGCAFTATVGMLWIAAPSGTLVRTAGYALPAGLGSFIDMIVTPMCAPLFIGFTFVVSISAIWLVLGRRWAAAILGWMICTVAFSSIGSGVQPRAVIWTIAAAITGLFVVLLVRVGVTAMVAANFAVLLNFSLLGGWDLSAWHQQPGRLNALLLLALGVYAFHTALAGRPILGAKLDER